MRTPRLAARLLVAALFLGLALPEAAAKGRGNPATRGPSRAAQKARTGKEAGDARALRAKQSAGQLGRGRDGKGGGALARSGGRTGQNRNGNAGKAGESGGLLRNRLAETTLRSDGAGATATRGGAAARTRTRTAAAAGRTRSASAQRRATQQATRSAVQRRIAQRRAAQRRANRQDTSRTGRRGASRSTRARTARAARPTRAAATEQTRALDMAAMSRQVASKVPLLSTGEKIGLAVALVAPMAIATAFGAPIAGAIGLGAVLIGGIGGLAERAIKRRSDPQGFAQQMGRAELMRFGNRQMLENHDLN